ncbi:FAD-binding dehydrogenase [Planococcus sp. ISL-110]|uniref:FAD-binding dehydrogenase n=1 Tax=Planococcus sp. ISL-110 TaxID=2819167 RepID=UPI001BE9B3AE|nr:FAD-binding dehydrogenase [Planococcus sp. ISL-110]MBT2571054.1 FAD-binding dehydrogenase [Planococcus sp. ISL-110]
MEFDAIIVGAGLAGLVAAAEIADAGKKVMLLDQEPEASFGGLFLIDSPEQRRMGINDSQELAWQDWLGAAGFDREQDEDHWGKRWAEAYVDFAANEKRTWLAGMGVKFFPVVGWAERGGYLAEGHGNSVPRFHIVWGTGPGIVAPFERRVREHMKKGLIEFRSRRQVDELLTEDGVVMGVSGSILEPSDAERGEASSRQGVDDFCYRAPAVVVTSGGIGGNHELIRRNWPSRLGKAPETMLSGVPEHVDGRMLAITEKAGGRIVNRDRMWHYTEGIKNWNPVWSKHGARNYRGDRLIRVAALHKLLDRKKGPLIAVRLNIVSRKTLGGLQTDLSSRVLDDNGQSVPGLYAAGEVADFGGGGVHGYRSLEETFLGGCLFSGRTAGRAVAGEGGCGSGF